MELTLLALHASIKNGMYLVGYLVIFFILPLIILACSSIQHTRIYNIHVFVKKNMRKINDPKLYLISLLSYKLQWVAIKCQRWPPVLNVITLIMNDVVAANEEYREYFNKEMKQCEKIDKANLFELVSGVAQNEISSP